MNELSNNKKITFIDLFAGCGGLSEGFLTTGKYEALAHVEWETPMVSTLRLRLMKKWKHSEEEAKKRVIHFDIQETDELINGQWSERNLMKYSGSNHHTIINSGLRGLVENQNVDMVIGGPPCQAYSIAGRAQDKNSMKDDYRNYLFESFVKVVKEFNPKVFVFENVPGLLSAKPGDIPVTERIFKAFQEINYIIRSPKKLAESVYTASDFGVPQKRNRIILIGVREDSDIKLEDLYTEINKTKTKTLTVEDAIRHLPKFIPLKNQYKKNGRNNSHELIGQKHVKYHDPRFHNERDISIFKKWISENMNGKSSSEKIEFYNNIMGKNSKHAKYRNLEWKKPSPTIVAHLYKDGLMFLHPDIEQARSITVKEAALIQSFPDDFDFVGSSGHAFKMIGNAVPPKMAEYIANAIAKIIK